MPAWSFKRAGETSAQKKLLRVSVVRRSGAGNDLFQGDSELVRAERAAFPNFLAQRDDLVPGIHEAPPPSARRLSLTYPYPTLRHHDQSSLAHGIRMSFDRFLRRWANTRHARMSSGSRNGYSAKSSARCPRPPACPGHVLGDAHVPNNRLAAENVRAQGDAVKQFLFSRHKPPSKDFMARLIVVQPGDCLLWTIQVHTEITCKKARSFSATSPSMPPSRVANWPSRCMAAASNTASVICRYP